MWSKTTIRRSVVLMMLCFFCLRNFGIQFPNGKQATQFVIHQGACTAERFQTTTTTTTRAQQNQTTTAQNGNHNIQRRYAYAFMVAGCTDVSCMYYVLNAVVTSTILRHYHSTSDIIFGVRMVSSSSSSSSTSPPPKRLTCQQEEWLQKAGIHLVYLPQVRVDNFGTASLEMFRVLEMTQYDRVYYLDADCIPLCNIDYHMDLTYYNGGDDDDDDTNAPKDMGSSKKLQNFVAFQGMREPINAGNWIVTPKAGLFQQVMDIIHRHRSKSKDFSPITGWGHTILNEQDRWIGSTTTGLMWNFHGFQIDQGLVYYWLKYEVMNWTLVFQNGTIQNWSQVHGITDNNKYSTIPISENRSIAVTDTFQLKQKPCGHLHSRGTEAGGNGDIVHGLLLDLYHYFGTPKPWTEPIRATDIPLSHNSSLKGRQVWLYWLGVANQTLNLQLPSVLDASFRSPYDFDWKSDRNMLLNPNVDIPKPMDPDVWKFRG